MHRRVPAAGIARDCGSGSQEGGKEQSGEKICKERGSSHFFTFLDLGGAGRCRNFFLRTASTSEVEAQTLKQR